MNIIKKILKEKTLLLKRYRVVEEFLIDCIANGDKGKEDELKEFQVEIDELDKIIKFLNK